MGLYTANGTRVTKASVAKTADPDPIVTITTDLYRHKRTGPEDDKVQGELTTLFCRAGHQLRQSALNNLFKPAQVTQLSPASGPRTGNTVVTVTGLYLDGVTHVEVDGNTAAFTLLSDRSLRFTAPAAGGAGAADLALTDDAGVTTLVDVYTYT